MSDDERKEAPSESGSSAADAHSVEIPEAKSSGGAKPFTLYCLKVRHNDKSWEVERRFSDFVRLREQLKTIMNDLPKLPSKTLIPSRNMVAQLVETRRKALGDFMSTICSTKAIVKSKEYVAFLKIAEYVDLETSEWPTITKTVKDKQFGVNDFVYDIKARALITACEDAHILSRLDSKISNFRLPWEKKTGHIVPVGSFNCWKLIKGVWKNHMSLYYDCQVSAVAWDAARAYAMVGLENGHIIVYLLHDDFHEATVIRESADHSARVTGIVYSKKHDTMISCSRDKLLNIYDMKKEKIVSSTVCGKAWLSSIEYDEESERIFLGTYARSVLVYDMSSGAPRLMHTLLGHEGSIRCLHFRPEQKILVSGGFDCSVGIWNIDETDTSKSRIGGWLKGGPAKKIKSVRHIPEYKLVVAAMEGGDLTLWNTETFSLEEIISSHTNTVVKMTWLEDRRTLITGGRDGEVKFFNFDGRPTTGFYGRPAS